MRAAFRFICDLLSIAHAHVKPTAQFVAGVGIGAGIGVTLKITLMEHMMEREMLAKQLAASERWKVVLQPVDTAVACPAAGYSIGYPTCYPIDAPLPPIQLFPLDPVDTTISCPAAGYTITFAACYPIDAPSPSPLPSPPSPPAFSFSSIGSTLHEPIASFVARNQDTITSVVVPSLYYLLDASTPMSSSARRHLVYLEPLMAAFAIHHLWLLVVAVLLSLEPDNVACQLLRALDAVTGTVFSLIETVRTFWHGLQPTVVENRVQEPAMLYSSMMPYSPAAGKNVSLNRSVPEVHQPSTSLEWPVMRDSDGSDMSLATPLSHNRPVEEPLPSATPSMPSPLPRSEPASLSTPASDLPVVPPLAQPSPVLPPRAPYIRRVRPRLADPVMVARVEVPHQYLPDDSSDRRGRESHRVASVEKGILRSRSENGVLVRRNPKVVRILQEEKVAYPSPRDTPPVPIGSTSASSATTGSTSSMRPRKRSTSSPTKWSMSARRPAKQEPMALIQIVETLASPDRPICPEVLDDDNSKTWNPRDIAALPVIAGSDMSCEPSPSFNDFLDRSRSDRLHPDPFACTSPFVPLHASSLRDRPASEDVTTSLQVTFESTCEAIQSHLPPSTLADDSHISELIDAQVEDQVLDGEDVLPVYDSNLQLQNPRLWKFVTAVVAPQEPYVTFAVREYPIGGALVAVKGVKVNASRKEKEGFWREVNAMWEVLQRQRSSRWCSHLLGTFVGQREMTLFCVYHPKGNVRNLIDSLSPRCLDAELARFYLAEMVLALTALHDAGIAYGSCTSLDIYISDSRHIVLCNFAYAVAYGEDPEPGNKLGLYPFRTWRRYDWYTMTLVYHEMYTGKSYLLDPDPKPRFDYLSSLTALQDLTDLDRSFMNMVIERVADKDAPLHEHDIMGHPIFDDVDWRAMDEQKVPVPPLRAGTRRPLLGRVQGCKRKPPGWGKPSPITAGESEHIQADT
ncbi:hypothetical protein CVT24_011062 [Panaeolus cyanescens]|uniref:non-specific serine/threonine protein kinase n=1 Tax=Panaeolus cyanescens TaxID=181874 RepID=A0A409VG03_9AGAR|nr:hypothetical protein CVT24_011062 [Panaeolus cyanescens]